MSRVTDTSDSLRTTQLLGLTALAYLAGQEAATVYLHTPSLLESPAPLLARQWLKTHVRTRAVTTPISVTLTLLLAYLTYKSKTPNKKYLLTSTLLLLTRFPYSEILLGPYNRRLSAKAESMATAGLDDVQAEANMSPGDTVHELVDRWANLYLGKALLVLGAGFSVLYGLV
ncbi:hypothetical protein Vi05172_g4225 [Venturia inaequalis]|uniref:DUF1772-domain-containing protein n=1 Tax=Venturia inaequalis TaxID=5025 RepID=A0A8H3VAK4_VENIN|nr:hypothetical protein EG327_004813 [Venturia inaequalis]RDI85835.1 hypothetical protein Vi05172_g4225 [Venturia inaequalis]